MKILEACNLFHKLAYVLFGVDAKDIKPEIVNAVKNAIKSAATQGKFDPDPVSRVGIDFPDMSFDLSIDNRDINVSDYFINTSDQAILDKYIKFPEQVKDYLTKYWELLPKKHDGKDIKYDSFTSRIEFP